MDLKEFDLMYNRASPLYDQRILEDVIRQALQKEQVPHSLGSTRGSQCEQFLAVNFKPKQKCGTGRTESEAKRKQLSNEFSNFNQSHTCVNGCSSQGSSSHAQYNPHTLTTNGYNVNSAVLGDNIQPQTRKIEHKDKIFTESHRNCQEHRDYFTDYFKEEGNTRLTNEDNDNRLPKSRDCKCREWGSGTCSNESTRCTSGMKLVI